MQQTKLGSAMESITNVLVGFTLAIVTQVLVFPMFGINVPLNDNFKICVVFTVISLVRSYAVRRWFNLRTRDV